MAFWVYKVSEMVFKVENVVFWKTMCSEQIIHFVVVDVHIQLDC